MRFHPGQAGCLWSAGPIDLERSMKPAPEKMDPHERFPLFDRTSRNPVSLRFKAHCALLLCSFLWGVTFVVVKNALVDISVFAYMAARFVLGALPMIWIYREDLRKLTRDELWAGIQVGLFMFGGYSFQTAGIARTTPSKAAFITGLSVVLVPVFLAAFWRKKIGAWAWGGAAASFTGLYFLTVPREGLADLNRGDLLVMGCAVLYAFPNHFHCALHRKIFARSIELSASDPCGSALHIGCAHTECDAP